MLRKTDEFQFGIPAKEAFHEIKDAITRRPDLYKRIILTPSVASCCRKIMRN